MPSWRTKAIQYRRLDAPLSNHADDLSGYANNGTWVGTELYQPNPWGTMAADFNQASHIDCGDEIVGAGAATVCAWIWLDDFGENTLGRILDNGNFDLYVNDTNDTLDFTSDGGGTVLQSANDAIKPNRWIFVAVSRDADGTARLYIGDTLSVTGASGTPAAGGGNLTIGDDVADANAFDGRICKVRVYVGVALTADELAAIRRWGL